MGSGSDHRSGLSGGDVKTQPLVAEVRPMEVKHDRENMGILDTAPVVKKVSVRLHYSYLPSIDVLHVHGISTYDACD